MTKSEAKNIKELVTFMKENKVQHFKMDGIEVLFSQLALMGPENIKPGQPSNPSLDYEPKSDVDDVYSNPMTYAAVG